MGHLTKGREAQHGKMCNFCSNKVNTSQELFSRLDLSSCTMVGPRGFLFNSFLANFAPRTASFFLLKRYAEFLSARRRRSISASRRKFPNKNDNIKRKPLGPE